MSTPSIPGIDRDALANAIVQNTRLDAWAAYDAAGAALAHIAAHHECVCDREHDDEWVEVDEGERADLPDGVRLREEWTKGRWEDTIRLLVHRDDLPDPDAKTILTALVQRVRATKEGCLAAQNFEGAMLWRDVEADLLDALRDLGWTVTRKGGR